MSLSRRQFLQFFGITTVSQSLDLAGIAPTINTASEIPTLIRGRVLQPASIYAEPSLNVAPLQTIWANTIVDLQETIPGWYRLAEGYVPQRLVQPIWPDLLSAEYQDILTPSAVRVTAPSATIREYAHQEADLVTKVGHGGALQAIDCIHYPNTGDWLQVAAADGRKIGWTQASHWQPIDDSRHNLVSAQINRQAHTLTINDAFVTPINLPTALPVGTQTLSRVTVGGGTAMYDGDTIEGVPNVMELETGQRLYGVYWHNQFGSVSQAIEINTNAARWLWAADELQINIR